MESTQTGLLTTNSFDFRWTVTLAANITCSDPILNHNTISIGPGNFTGYIDSDDILEGSPYVPENEYIYPYDHKHELVFQLHEVDNEYDGKIGTLTWKYIWQFPSVAGLDEWDFFFPDNGVPCSFNPDRNYLVLRVIYINGQYENISISQL